MNSTPLLETTAQEVLAPETAQEGRFFKLGLLWFALYGLTGAILFTWLALRVLPYRGEALYTEAVVAYESITFSHTGHIYVSIDAPPYTPQPYGPLFYAYNAGLGWLARSDLMRMLLFGRIVTFACFLLCGLLIYIVARRLDSPPFRAALGSLLFLAFPYNFPFNASVRPDFPCVALMLLSLLCVMPGDPNSLSAYMFAGVVAGLAFLVKQPGFATCISIILVLALKKRYLQGAIFLLSAGVPVVAMFGILTLRHERVWSQIAVVGGAVWSFRSGVNWVWEMLLRNPNCMVPVSCSILALPFAARANERTQMAVSFAFVNLLTALASIPQLGGAVNYFFPAFVGGAILLPLAMEVTARSGKVSQAAICALAVVWLTMGASKSLGPAWTMARTPVKQPSLMAVAALQSFRILSDRPSYDLLGREPEFLDPALLHMLERKGLWNPAPLVEDTRGGKFDLIILASAGPAVTAYRGVSYFSQGEADAIDTAYEPVCRIFPHPGERSGVVLEPRGRDIRVSSGVLSELLGRVCEPQAPGAAPDVHLLPNAR